MCVVGVCMHVVCVTVRVRDCVCCRQSGQRRPADHMEGVCLQLAGPHLVCGQNHQYLLDECKCGPLSSSFGAHYFSTFFFFSFFSPSVKHLNAMAVAMQKQREKRSPSDVAKTIKCVAVVTVLRCSYFFYDYF